MNLQELETKKRELIEEVDSWNMRTEEGEAKKALIIKLLRGTEADDVDFSEALEDETAEGLISLLFDCYSLEDFVKWLYKLDFDLFRDYRYADKIDINEAIENIEYYKSLQPYCYGLTYEDFEKAETKEEKIRLIKENFDGLIYSDKCLVLSW